MSKQTQPFSISQFYCTKCGNKGMDIPRKKGKIREKGHLKKLYCLYCKEETNHAEIREIGGYTYEDFLQEFNAGIFVDGERQELYLCSKTDCEYNKDNKCWNCKNECPYKPKKGNDNNA